VSESDRLSELTTQLEQAAAALRAGDLEPERAAELAAESARLAAEAAAELDRRVRAAPRP
jgi:hypothetical protein